MEIIIVGWHLMDAPYICDRKECDRKAAFLVAYKGDEWDSFNLCSECANSERYKIVGDKIADVFKNLGM